MYAYSNRFHVHVAIESGHSDSFSEVARSSCMWSRLWQSKPNIDTNETLGWDQTYIHTQVEQLDTTQLDIQAKYQSWEPLHDFCSFELCPNTNPDQDAGVVCWSAYVYIRPQWRRRNAKQHPDMWSQATSPHPGFVPLYEPCFQQCTLQHVATVKSPSQVYAQQMAIPTVSLRCWNRTNFWIRIGL
jgi:hypothetical protein